MLKNRVSHIMKESLTPLLKQHGFRKHGNVYIREVEPMVQHLVDIQFSRWNDAREVNFTLNCGIYVRGVTSTFMNVPERARPTLGYCCISARVGTLRQPHMDDWWKVLVDDEPERDVQIGRELRSAIEETILPFLDRFQDERSVAEFLSRPPTEADKSVSPQADGFRLAYAAVIWSRLGSPEKARDAIAQAVQRSRKTPIEEVVNAFANRFKP